LALQRSDPMQKSIYNQQKPFVYLWRDRLTNRYYLGYHNGKNPRYVCSSKYMRREYKERPSDFRRRILKIGSKKEMIKLERKLLISRRNQFGKRYYNLIVSAENGFPEWTDEMKKTKSLSLKGKKKSEETIRKMSQPRSEEHKRNLSKAHLGIKHTIATRLKMSKSMTGIKKGPQSEERKSKASEWMKEYWRQRKIIA